MLGTGNFTDFLGKYPVPWKWHSGTQTSSMDLQDLKTKCFEGLFNVTFVFLAVLEGSVYFKVLSYGRVSAWKQICKF